VVTVVVTGSDVVMVFVVLVGIDVVTVEVDSSVVILFVVSGWPATKTTTSITPRKVKQTADNVQGNRAIR
jgi:hypothetical protein